MFQLVATKYSTCILKSKISSCSGLSTYHIRKQRQILQKKKKVKKRKRKSLKIESQSRKEPHTMRTIQCLLEVTPKDNQSFELNV